MAVYGSTCFQNLRVDHVKWEDLPTFKKEFNWLLSSSSDDFFEWIKVQSQDLCEGSRVLTEVKIFQDWTFIVHVNRQKVAKETIGVSELKADELNYFQSCARLLFVISVTTCCGSQLTKALS